MSGQDFLVIIRRGKANRRFDYCSGPHLPIWQIPGGILWHAGKRTEDKLFATFDELHNTVL
jgi:hypothetical protein